MKNEFNFDLLKEHHPRKHMKRFFYAFSGLAHIFKTEANFRIHILATLFVCTFALYLNFTSIEWMVLILTIGFVLFTEAINTLMERVIDHLIHEHHEGAKVIKDVAAAAVLIATLVSMLVGGFLFLPKIF